MVGQIDSHLQSRRVLRVWRFDGRETAITHVLFRHSEEIEPEFFQQDRDEHATGAVEGGENNFEISGLLTLQQLGLQHHRLDTGKVLLVHVGAEHRQFTLLISRHGRVGLVLDRVDLFDDACGMRFDDARTIAEINFEAVVMGRIVTGGEHDAGIGAELTDSEGHFRCRAAAVEEIDVSAVFHGDPGTCLSEFRRKVARVVSEDDTRPAAETGIGAVGFGIGHEATGGPPHVVIVHRIRSDAGMVRPLVRRGSALLSGGHHLANRAPAQAAGAKFQRLKEAVIELGPLAGCREFFNAGTINRVRAGCEQGQDVCVAGREELTGVSGGLESGFERHRRARG